MTEISPQAVSFDLDETLRDGRDFQMSIVRTCRQVAAMQPSLDAGRLVEANTEVFQTYWPEVEDQWSLGTLDGASAGLEVWRRTLLACGCADETLWRFAAQTHWRLERQAHRLFDDVHELFVQLRAVSLPLALITNGASDTQWEKLRTLGLENWFDVVVISGEVGVKKPRSSHIRTCSGRARRRRRRTVACG